jgi:hypothetical protein
VPEVRDEELPRRRVRWMWPEGFAAGVVGLPFLAAIIRAFRGTGRLGGDLAVTELAVRSVGTQAVLVGPYSRFGWNHPGPLYFYLLAPFYWLAGADGRAINAGAILLGLAAAASILIFARRRGGSGLMLWTAIVLALLVWHLDEAAWSSWTPYVTVMPAAAFLMAAWSLGCVDRWALPLAVVTGSFVIQTHIGYLPLVVSVGAAAFVVCVVRVGRYRRTLRQWRIPTVLAVGLFVVVWLPPVIDAFVNDPSNLDQLRAFWEHPVAQETHSASDGWSVATRGLSGFLDGRTETADPDVSGRGASWDSLIAAAAVVAAGALALRRRHWDVLVLLGLLAVAFAASIYAVSQVVDELFLHLVLWTSVLSFVAWVAVGAAAVPELTRSRATARVSAAIAVLSGLAAVILIWPGITPIDSANPRAEVMISHVERHLPDRRPVVVRLGASADWEWATTLVAGLRDDGFHVHGERQPGAMTIVFEPRDLRDVQPSDALVTIVGERSECGTAELCVPESR